MKTRAGVAQCSHPLPSRHLTLPSEGNVNSEQTTSSNLIFFWVYSANQPFIQHTEGTIDTSSKGPGKWLLRETSVMMPHEFPQLVPDSIGSSRLLPTVTRQEQRLTFKSAHCTLVSEGRGPDTSTVLKRPLLWASTTAKLTWFSPSFLGDPLLQGWDPPIHSQTSSPGQWGKKTPAFKIKSQILRKEGAAVGSDAYIACLEEECPLQAWSLLCRRMKSLYQRFSALKCNQVTCGGGGREYLVKVQVLSQLVWSEAEIPHPTWCWRCWSMDHTLRSQALEVSVVIMRFS